MRMPDGRECGPLTKAELDRWVAEGRINAECQVWTPDMTQCKWANEVNPILEQLGTDPPSSSDGSGFPFNPGVVAGSGSSFSQPSQTRKRRSRVKEIRRLAWLGYLTFGITARAAVSMAEEDLKEMEAGRMSHEGFRATQSALKFATKSTWEWCLPIVLAIYVALRVIRDIFK